MSRAHANDWESVRVLSRDMKRSGSTLERGHDPQTEGSARDDQRDVRGFLAGVAADLTAPPGAKRQSEPASSPPVNTTLLLMDEIPRLRGGTNELKTVTLTASHGTRSPSKPKVKRPRAAALSATLWLPAGGPGSPFARGQAMPRSSPRCVDLAIRSPQRYAHPSRAGRCATSAAGS